MTIIHAGGGEEYGGNDANNIWSHSWSLASSVTYDGKRMQPYHTEPERRGWDADPGTQGLTRIGVICHENGHFLGLPDLYDYGYDSQGAGNFCLMAGGSWNGDLGTTPAQMSAYCKYLLGWVTPTLVTGEGTFNVPRVEDNATIYRLGGNFPPTQYFLIENRQGVKFDAALPGSSRGLLIWHVDETVANNDDQNHYKVDLEEASGVQHLQLNSNSGDDADYFRSGNATAFSSITTPNNLSYSGVQLGLNINRVSATASNMTFSVGPLPVDHFEWATIPSPRTNNVPFPVQVSARDALGNLVTSFRGAVAVAGSVVNNVTIGSGDGAWTQPLCTFWHDSRTQVIYLQSELGPARTIQSLALDVSTLPGQPLNNWTIRMKHTSLNSYAAGAWETADWTVVYQKNEVINTSGWVVFLFSTPFSYNGVQNLMIDFSHNNSSYTTSGVVHSTSASSSRSVYFYTDSGYGDPLLWSGSYPTTWLSTYVPNIRLGSPQIDIPITPKVSGAFVDGHWQGMMTVTSIADNVVLTATDPSGLCGTSNPFDVIVDPYNHAPTAANFSAGTRENQALSFSVQKLLLTAKDPDNDALTLTGLSAGSLNGGLVSTDSATITFTPAPGFVGEDRFNYSVADGRGGLSSAQVIVQVRAAGQASLNMLPLHSIPGGWAVSFAGIPGFSYTLQRSISSSGPWTTLGSVSVGQSGIGYYEDRNPPSGTAFYRTIYP